MGFNPPLNIDYKLLIQCVKINSSQWGQKSANWYILYSFLYIDMEQLRFFRFFKSLDCEGQYLAKVMFLSDTNNSEL